MFIIINKNANFADAIDSIFMKQQTSEDILHKLKAENCFWSYDKDSIKDVPDDILIEKTLVYLDLPEIDALFSIFPFQKVKKVWLKHLVPQGEYLYTLNRFLAWYYFHIKRPDAYLKSMETRYLNRMLQ